MDKSTSNIRAQNTWNAKPVGSQKSNAPLGSKEYFEDLRRYRYGYETPFIPRLFCFDQLLGKKVLEVGIGNGVDAVEMVKHGALYTGIDITEKHLDLTKENFKHHELNQPSLIFSDLLNTNIHENFDYIYSFGVMHHITHEEDYLHVFHKLLKQNGKLMVGVYSKYSFFHFYLMTSWLLKNRMKNTFHEWCSHYAELSPLDQPVTIKIRSKREIKNLLEQCGFKVIHYYKRGFVQNYLPVVGKYFSPDGMILNMLGSLLGWYHIIIAAKQ